MCVNSANKRYSHIKEFLETLDEELRISRITCVEYLSCPFFSDTDICEAEHDFDDFDIIELSESSCKISSNLRRINLRKKGKLIEI